MKNIQDEDISWIDFDLIDDLVSMAQDKAIDITF